MEDRGIFHPAVFVEGHDLIRVRPGISANLENGMIGAMGRGRMHSSFPNEFGGGMAVLFSASGRGFRQRLSGTKKKSTLPPSEINLNPSPQRSIL
jgi:hypothetical protein